MQSTNAILIRRTKLTETSLIVTWITEKEGKVRTVGKAARAPKSGFFGSLDLFFRCEIGFVPSRRSDLHSLREVRLIETFANLRYDYSRLSLAAYFAELLELVTEPEHPVPELYDLLRRALSHLDQEAASLRALLHFERQLAQQLGVYQADILPAEAIAHAYHRLPETRGRLLHEFKSASPPRTS